MIGSPCQRWREGRDSYRPAREVVDTRTMEVAPIAQDAVARAFVLTHHYAGSFPAARRRFGLYQSGALVGVAVFSVPVRTEVLRPLPDPSAAADLGRFVLLDHVGANAETWFLARCSDLLRREGWCGFVSFSDPFERRAADGRTVFGGHVGTIYQASNAVYLGQSDANTLRLLPDGRVFSRRAESKIRARDTGWQYSVEALVRAGATAPTETGTPEALALWLPVALATATRRARHPGNLKYVFALDKSTRRALPPSKPYPKLASVLAQGGLL